MDLEMKKETPETLKPYEFHSLEFSINGTEAKSDCPSCGAVNKLFISKKTGQYDCKLCGNSGNKYTFMTEIHSNLLSSTSDQDYKRIKKLRGNLFPEDFLKKHELCLDEK
jgi:ribosomal protein L37AE/L43A